MKVIITGATGLVGDAVLRHCISRKDITSIIVITRRSIPENLVSDPKVTAIIHDDFLNYPDDLLEKCNGAEACLWAQGLRGAPFGYWDIQNANKVDVEFPVAAAKAFLEHLLQQTPSQHFRFVLCSGVGAEWDQEKSFWFMGQTCRLKGLAEQKLRAFTDQNSAFELYTVRPFGIIPEHAGWLHLTLRPKVMPCLKVMELAALMTDLGVNGETKWMWEHEEIKEKGGELLRIKSGM